MVEGSKTCVLLVRQPGVAHVVLSLHVGAQVGPGGLQRGVELLRPGAASRAVRLDHLAGLEGGGPATRPLQRWPGGPGIAGRAEVARGHGACGHGAGGPDDEPGERHQNVSGWLAGYGLAAGTACTLDRNGVVVRLPKCTAEPWPLTSAEIATFVPVEPATTWTTSAAVPVSISRFWPAVKTVPPEATGRPVPPALVAPEVCGSAHAQAGATEYVMAIVPPTGTRYVPATVPTWLPLTLTEVSVPPEMVTATTEPELLVAVTVVAGTAGVLMTGVPSANRHSQPVHR